MPGSEGAGSILVERRGSNGEILAQKTAGKTVRGSVAGCWGGLRRHFPPPPRDRTLDARPTELWGGGEGSVANPPFRAGTRNPDAKDGDGGGGCGGRFVLGLLLLISAKSVYCQPSNPRCHIPSHRAPVSLSLNAVPTGPKRASVQENLAQLAPSP